MKPMGTKDRKDLFFQYVLLFTLTAVAFIASLFLTREDMPNNAVDENERALYTEFSDFEHLQPKLIKLMDTVVQEANKIATLNAGGNASVSLANQLINDFNIEHSKQVLNPFVSESIKLLQLHVKLNTDIKAGEDETVRLKKNLEECAKDLADKKIDDRMDKIIKSNQSAGQTP